MGQLSAHLGWYARRCVETGTDDELPAVHWAYQRKNEEAATGLDFGLVKVIDATSVRVLLFQAKIAERSKDGAETFSIEQTSGPKRDPVTDDGLRRLLAGGENGERERTECRKAHVYQVERFMRTMLAFDTGGGRSVEWCFYVLWRRTFGDRAMPLPATWPLRRLFRELQRGVEAEGVWRKKMPVTDEHPSFLEVATSFLNTEPAGSGMLLENSQLDTFINTVMPLMPGVRLIVTARNGQDMDRTRKALPSLSFSQDLLQTRAVDPAPKM